MWIFELCLLHLSTYNSSCNDIINWTFINKCNQSLTESDCQKQCCKYTHRRQCQIRAQRETRDGYNAKLAQQNIGLKILLFIWMMYQEGTFNFRLNDQSENESNLVYCVKKGEITSYLIVTFRLDLFGTKNRKDGAHCSNA